MQFVALAGIDTEAISTVTSKLSGKRADNTDPLRLAIAPGHVGELPFTLISLPSEPRAHSQSLLGEIMADAAILVIDAKAGWGSYESSLADELRSIGVHTVVVAIDDAENCSASLPHAIRQQLGICEFAQTAIVMINTHKGDVAELLSTLGAVLDNIPVTGYSGPTRLWIQRSYAKEKVGTVAVGFVTGQTLSTDTKLSTLEGREVDVRALQQLEARTTASSPGAYVAANLSEIDPKLIPANTLLIDAAAKGRINQVESVLTVRRSTHASVHATRTYLAQIGTLTCYAALNTLEGASLDPGHRGAVRIRLSRPLPLFVGDRIALCDLNTGEVIAGGTVSETAVAIDAIDRDDMDSALRSRGWIDVEEYERMSGHFRPATVGRWVVDLSALEEASGRIRSLVSQSGSGGIDMSSLSEKELAVLRTLSGIEMVGGRAFMVGVEPDLAMRASRTATLGI